MRMGEMGDQVSKVLVLGEEGEKYLLLVKSGELMYFGEVGVRCERFMDEGVGVGGGAGSAHRS